MNQTGIQIPPDHFWHQSVCYSVLKPMKNLKGAVQRCWVCLNLWDLLFCCTERNTGPITFQRFVIVLTDLKPICAIGHELSDNGFMCRVCMRWSLKGYLPYFRKERKETCCIQQPSSLLDICTQICSPSILTEVSSHSDGVKKVFRSLAKQNSWCSVFTLRWGDYTPHMLEVISFKPARCWFLICRGQNQTNVFSYTWLVQRCFYHTFNLHQTMQL